MINNKYSSNYFFVLSKKEKEELQLLLDFYEKLKEQVNNIERKNEIELTPSLSF